MPAKIEYNDQLRIIEIVFSGRVTTYDLEAATRDAILLGKERETHQYLIDTDGPVPGFSFMNIYTLPRDSYPSQKLSRISRIAIVLPEDKTMHEFVEFYETVCQDQGWFVLKFPDRNMALDWLLASY